MLSTTRIVALLSTAGHGAAGSEAAASGTEAGRRFFQRRFLLYAFLVAVLSTIFLPMMRSLEAAGSRPLSDWAVASLSPFHIAGSASSWLVCLALLLRQWGAQGLRVGEAAFTLAVTGCWVGMGFGARPGVHTELFTLLAVTNTIVARAAFVPSPARRTLLVSLVPCVALVAAVVAIHRDVPPIDRLGFAMVTGTWCVVALTVATAVSAVIYGLRREAARAMQLGQYRLEGKVGQGGMGVVYRASHALLRRPTAVKLLVSASGNPQMLERFEHEVQMTAALSHANIVTVYDYGRTPDDVFYYAMEYLDGVTLQEAVDTFGPMPPGRAIHVLAQVCAGLAEAHASHLIHRDVKPANIMLTHAHGAFDVVKVLDFGLVKAVDAAGLGFTQVGTFAGTPAYVAPETVMGRAVDQRVDLYALGGVAYFLLTGHTVFEAPNVLGLCALHASASPVPPSVRLGRELPQDLERLILATLAKDPSDRPESALALREALLACADANGWLRRDADAWWAEHRPAITRIRVEREATPSGGATIAVDFRRR